MNKTILFFIVKNFPKNILLFSKNFYIIYIENRKEGFIMKCENCAWAVWYYNEVVECCGGPCPSEADFEAAEKIGCLAMDGMAEEKGDM